MLPAAQGNFDPPRFPDLLGVLQRAACARAEPRRPGVALLKCNPRHPSLHFKKVGRFWSVRVGLHHRAIGVLRSERAGGLQDLDRPVAYAPFAQQPTPRINLIVRVHGDVSTAMRGIREAVRQIDPRLPLGAMRTMEEVKERSFAGTTQSTWAIGAFAVVAALLAAFGLYGVLAQTVTQQRREIGIRIALGASSEEIVACVVRNAAAMVAVGLAIGLAGAFALTGLMKSLLFQVSPLDPVVFAIAGGSMMLVGLLAVFLPAHRAAHVDPVTTLRDEGC